MVQTAKFSFFHPLDRSLNKFPYTYSTLVEYVRIKTYKNSYSNDITECIERFFKKLGLFWVWLEDSDSLKKKKTFLN